TRRRRACSSANRRGRSARGNSLQGWPAVSRHHDAKRGALQAREVRQEETGLSAGALTERFRLETRARICFDRDFQPNGATPQSRRARKMAMNMIELG